MPYGFPRFPKSTFPKDEPPTLFHPASPKMTPVRKSIDDIDKASISTTSTFSSKIGLLKDNIKSKIPAQHRACRSRKVATCITGVHKDDQRRPTEMKTPKQATAEAYMIWAATR